MYSDLELNSNHLKIRIRESKGYQIRQGNEMVIARTGSSHCPVAMLGEGGNHPGQ